MNKELWIGRCLLFGALAAIILEKLAIDAKPPLIRTSAAVEAVVAAATISIGFAGFLILYFEARERR